MMVGLGAWIEEPRLSGSDTDENSMTCLFKRPACRLRFRLISVSGKVAEALPDRAEVRDVPSIARPAGATRPYDGTRTGGTP